MVHRPYQARGGARLYLCQGKFDRGKLTLTRVRVNEYARTAVKELRSNPLRMRSQDHTGLSEIKFLESIEDTGQKSAMAQRQESLGKPNSRRLASGENDILRFLGFAQK
jgi:hypothetical protein